MTQIKGGYEFTPAQSENIYFLKDIKTKLREEGMTGKVFGEFVPTTTGQAVVGGALVAGSILAPPIVGGLISAGIEEETSTLGKIQ